ncbi:MAG: N-acetylmuramoyl-L-alanine amidase [Planctomycetes bacterium]|jgi:N-acetylmuramoyl-L-alanine amidase|nr:N-acetylmuramoyl-L-alanine amidase [Planctomycetota bacterium]
MTSPHGIAGLALAALLAACATSPDPAPAPPDREPLLTVGALAERLGLRLVTNTTARATLEGPGNTVTIFPDPARYLYVNGRAFGPVSGIVPVGGTLAVPASLAPRIRPALRPAPPPPPPPPPPAPAPAPKPAPKPPKGLAAFRVTIDPGHGGKDPGARAVTGVYEKSLNLAIGKMVAEDLTAKGANVVMTRRGDSSVELEERAAIANRFGAHVFLSLHADSSPKPAVRGFTVYVSRSASAESNRLAKAVAAELQSLGIESRGVRQADYRVLVKTKMPAVLVEVGYLTNAAEANHLFAPGTQKRIAGAIARGIERALAGR